VFYVELCFYMYDLRRTPKKRYLWRARGVQFACSEGCYHSARETILIWEPLLLAAYRTTL